MLVKNVGPKIETRILENLKSVTIVFNSGEMLISKFNKQQMQTIEKE